MKTSVLSLIAAILALSGCMNTGQQMPIEYRLPPNEPGTRLDSEESLDFIIPYRMGATDTIVITVKRHPEFGGTFTLNADGDIVMPITDRKIRMRGLTTDEAVRRVKDEIAAYVNLEPEVKVEVQNAASQVYYVIGAVVSQGKYSLGLDRLTVRDVLFKAGLNAAEADMTKVYVIEPDPDNPKYVVLNAEDLIFNRLRYNIPVKNGDVIYIPTTTSSKIDTIIDAILFRASQAMRIDSYIREIKDRANEK
jgi:protein involved in polysaccharide export with SLBB domain